MNKILLEERMYCLKKEFESFREKVNQYKYISLFGVGNQAELWGYEFVKEWSRNNIICFVDNNPEIWGKTIIDNLSCVSPEQLARYGKDMLSVILTGKSSQKEIMLQLKRQETDAIGIDDCWLYIDELIEKYLSVKLPEIWEGSCEMGHYNKPLEEKSKIAVFTCIVNDYDELIQPLIPDEQCDYYCLGLKKPRNTGIYKWLDISKMIPDYILGDFVRMNRYCKLHPHILFPQYRYSIYVDGHISICGKLSELITRIGKTGIASYGMIPFRDTYEHANSIWYCRFKGERREVISEQMQKYAHEGFPRYYGMSENGVIVREHHNRDCIKIMNTWWNEIKNYSRRDQLSFFYSIWKNGFTAQDIGYIDATFRNGPEFKIRKHKKKNEIHKFNR